MRDLITSYLSEETGSAAAEYALILAVVCGGIVGAAVLLGTDISTAITNVATYISTSFPAA